MGKIDTSKWGEFLVGDLFDAERGKVKNLQNQRAGDIPVIAAGGFNQGIAGMFDVPALYENKITISCNGAGCGSVFYHPYKFNLNGDAIVLTELNPMSDLVKQFISCMLNGVLTRKYSYAEKCSADKAKSEKIKLPVDINGNPNFAYMEEYMKNLEIAVSSSLTALRSAENSKNCEKIDIASWKEVHLYDIFNIDSGTKLDKAKMDTTSAEICFVGRSGVNNGITQKVKRIEGLTPYNAGNLTLSLGGAYLGSCFVQEEPFYTSQNVAVLIPKDCMSFYAKQFIATAIFKESQNNYKAFIKELNAFIKTTFSIKLPVTRSGKIDYGFMESYMQKKYSMAEQYFKNLKDI